MLIKASRGWRSNIVIQAPEIGEPEFTNANIDLLNTGAIAGHIEPEVIVRIDVPTVIEPLATPKGDFGSALEHVGHFEVRLAQHEIEIVALFTSAANSTDESGAILTLKNSRCQLQGAIPHVWVGSQNVGLCPGYAHVGVFFVP